MIFVITGNGKGKTSSALGMVARAFGHGGKCAVMQFIKTGCEGFGEYRTFTKLGVPWSSWGEGFTWNLQNLDHSKELCSQGWDEFKQMACSGSFFMIVLDEFTYVMNMGLISVDEVVAFFKENSGKVGFPHVVVTGRNAPDALVAIADTVSEVVEVKHHYSKGVKASEGIEF